jgi:hypothetical protein
LDSERPDALNGRLRRPAVEVVEDAGDLGSQIAVLIERSGIPFLRRPGGCLALDKVGRAAEVAGGCAVGAIDKVKAIPCALRNAVKGAVARERRRAAMRSMSTRSTAAGGVAARGGCPGTLTMAYA